MAKVIEYESCVVVGDTRRGLEMHAEAEARTSRPSIEQRLNYENRGAGGSGTRNTHSD